MRLHESIADAALDLIGTPFLFRGRDPAVGLDCVGLVLAALRTAGVALLEPPSYQMRGTSLGRAEDALRAGGFAPVTAVQPGDVLLVRSGPLQLHLMIRAGAGVVHAHAGIGRAVLMPQPWPWPVLGAWRHHLCSGTSD